MRNIDNVALYMLEQYEANQPPMDPQYITIDYHGRRYSCDVQQDMQELMQELMNTRVNPDAREDDIDVKHSWLEEPLEEINITEDLEMEAGELGLHNTDYRIKCLNLLFEYSIYTTNNYVTS